MSFRFTLNPALDAEALSETFSAGGHISIPDFLERDCATKLHEALSTRQDWAWAINAGGHVYDLGREARDAMIRRNCRQRGNLMPADIHRLRAARMEAAAGRRL